MAEFDLIKKIINTQSLSRQDVITSIGDDCAILKVPDGYSLAVSTDTLVAGVHFPEQSSPYSIGYKSLAVNLSDLAASGAEPAWASLSLTMPEADKFWLQEFMRGFHELANQFNLQLIGGDTSRGPLSISVTIHGFVKQPLLRNGALKDDLIYVSGFLGDASLGFDYFQPDDEKDNQPQARFKRPLPRVELGLALTGLATSCIDISDGLVSDLTHVCDQSLLGAEILLKKIPLSEDYRAHHLTINYENALNFGDDYELCFSVSEQHKDKIEEISSALQVPLTCIGRFTDNKEIVFLDETGSSVIFKRGFEHFS